MVLTKRQLIAKTAKALGEGFTIDDVNEVYTALQDVAETHLNEANEDEPVTIKFGNGLTVTSRIKEVDQRPRMWYKARISRYHNRVAVNEFEH